jgi:hypothetical protein
MVALSPCVSHTHLFSVSSKILITCLVILVYKSQESAEGTIDKCRNKKLCLNLLPNIVVQLLLLMFRSWQVSASNLACRRAILNYNVHASSQSLQADGRLVPLGYGRSFLILYNLFLINHPIERRYIMSLSSTPIVEAVCFSKTLASTYKYTPGYNQEDQLWHLYRLEIRKSHLSFPCRFHLSPLYTSHMIIILLCSYCWVTNGSACSYRKFLWWYMHTEGSRALCSCFFNERHVQGGLYTSNAINNSVWWPAGHSFNEPRRKGVANVCRK